MQPLRSHTGRAVPLRRTNVDTDQIIPSEYLKRTSRSGFADGLFQQWRAEPGFPLDDPRYQGATILLAGRDFGVGSSREHAVWALQDFGFRVVLAPRFGDIFRGNAGLSGLAALIVSEESLELLWSTVEADPQAELTVDLVARSLDCPAAGLRIGIDLDDATRWRLIEGLDDIALTLRAEADILRYEQHRPAELPTTR